MAKIFYMFYLLMATSTAYLASVQSPSSVVSSDYQVLSDGNILDGAPSAEELAAFVAKTRASFVFFKAGTFDMGDWGPEVNEGGFPFDGPDSKPLHRVRLDAFAISKYPVTYTDFDMFTASLRMARINQNSVIQSYRKPNNPAGVSWQGAHDYCKWLGKLTGLSTELPTEAQWEYAARSGGRRVRYPTDNGQYEPGRNLPSFEQHESAGGHVPVDSFPPNPAGIYYMSAGVREWTNDWYDKDYYAHSPVENPKGPTSGATRVVRGNFGDGGSEMTFKRWEGMPGEQTGTWTMYFKERGKPPAQIPYTMYSHLPSTVFRCVIN